MPQSHGQPAQQGSRQRTNANRPGRSAGSSSLPSIYGPLTREGWQTACPPKPPTTPGYRVILLGEDGYIQAQESTFLSLPHQDFRIVAIQPRGGGHLSAPPSTNDNSSSRGVSSNWSMDGSNSPNWRYYKDKGSHDNDTTSIATEASNKMDRQGAGDNPSHHGLV